MKLELTPIRLVEAETASLQGDLVEFWSRQTEADAHLRYGCPIAGVAEKIRYMLSVCEVDIPVYENGLLIANLVAAEDRNDRGFLNFGIEVDGDYRRRGLARELIDRLMEYAKVTERIGIVGQCLPENIKMIRLLHSLPYEKYFSFRSGYQTIKLLRPNSDYSCFELI